MTPSVNHLVADGLFDACPTLFCIVLFCFLFYFFGFRNFVFDSHPQTPGLSLSPQKRLQLYAWDPLPTWNLRESGNRWFPVMTHDSRTAGCSYLCSGAAQHLSDVAVFSTGTWRLATNQKLLITNCNIRICTPGRRVRIIKKI